MNILYIAHRIPYPPDKGDKIRSFNQIKYFSDRHSVDLVCMNDGRRNMGHEYALKKYCRKIHVYTYPKVIGRLNGILFMLKRKPISVGNFYLNIVQTKIDRMISENDYDAIFCFSSSMAEYIFNTKFNEKLKKIRLIMDFCDVDSDKWLQYSRASKFPMKHIYENEYRVLKKYEYKVHNYFTHSIFISEYEKALFEKQSGKVNKLEIVKNGVDTNYFSKEYHKLKKQVNSNLNGCDGSEINKPMILFVGAMDYKANIEGVLWFIKKIYPMVKNAFSDIKFYIVGSSPDRRIMAYHNYNGIVVTGYVKDVRHFYQSATVCVVPLKLARGIQNKVLEALSMECPTVSTYKVAKAIGAINNKHLIVADDERRFADSIIKLLEDRRFAQKIAFSARKFVVDYYNWKRNMSKIDQLFSEAYW